MRTHGWLLAVALLAAFVVFDYAPGARAQAPFGVMTFNIRTANVPDGDNAWTLRKALVTETIERFAPQAIGLQEVVAEQLEYLASRLHDYRWLGVDRGLNGGRGLSEYTPIFYRHAELLAIESGTFWLSLTPDTPNVSRQRGRAARIVTWARFHHVATGGQIYMFNTHFTPRGGQVQRDSARIMRERIEAIPAGSPVIVTGDFNAIAEDSGVWRDFTTGGLRDAWIVAAERRGPAGTMNGFGPPREGDMTRIDWILVGGPIGVHSVETVIHDEHGRYPSDHYPVAAQLEIR